jgi:hypothetical protein
MEPRTVINTIKSLDKEGRVALAKSVRTDPDAWNAVNGIGNVNKNLPDGEIRGIVKGGPKLLPGADIRIANKEDNWTTTSNEEGNFAVHLPPGTYRMSISRTNYYETVIDDVLVISGVVNTVNVEMTETK